MIVPGGKHALQALAFHPGKLPISNHPTNNIMSQFETQARDGQPQKKGAHKLAFKRRMAAKRAKESSSPHGAVDEGSVFITLERKGRP